MRTLPPWQNHLGRIARRYLRLMCLALTLLGATACHRRTATTSSVGVSVELFAVTFDAEGVRYWRDEQPLSRASGTPENTVRALLTRHASDPNTQGCDARMIHSTSWRYQDRGRVVLTYLAYLPPQSALLTGSKRLRTEDIPGQPPTDALHPRPPHIAEFDVLGHGLRHLAFLMAREPDGVVAHALGPAGRMLLWRLTPTVAGQLSAP